MRKNPSVMLQVLFVLQHAAEKKNFPSAELSFTHVISNSRFGCAQ